MNVAATMTLTPRGRSSAAGAQATAAPRRRPGDRQARSPGRGTRPDAAPSRRSRARRPGAEAGQPAPALDAEQVAAGGRPLRRRIKTAWISFFAREHPREPHRSAPTGDASRGSAHPASTPRPAARPQQPGQRPRVEPIGLGPGLTDPGVARRDHDHARHMRLENPRDLPRIARHLQRDPVARVKALPEQLQRLRAEPRSDRPTAAARRRRSRPRRSRDAHPALPPSRFPPHR